MLKIMVEHIDSLVIAIMPGENLDGPSKHAWHERAVSLRKHGQVSGLGLPFHRCRIVRGHHREHAGYFTDRLLNMHVLFGRILIIPPRTTFAGPNLFSSRFWRMIQRCMAPG